MQCPWGPKTTYILKIFALIYLSLKWLYTYNTEYLCFTVPCCEPSSMQWGFFPLLPLYKAKSFFCSITMYNLNSPIQMHIKLLSNHWRISIWRELKLNYERPVNQVFTLSPARGRYLSEHEENTFPMTILEIKLFKDPYGEQFLGPDNELLPSHKHEPGPFESTS